MDKNKAKKRGGKRAGKYLMLTPATLLLVFAFFVPLISLFSISLYQGAAGSGRINTDVVSLANFARMFDPYYLSVLWRTFRLALYATVLSLILGYPVAMAMAKGSNRVKNILLALILTPLLTNVVARTLGLMIIFANNGPVNQFITALGLDKVKFIPSELGIVLGLTQVFMPYMILSIKSVLENVNTNLEEAARDMGCSRIGAFFKVTFPLSMPGVVAGSLFVFLLSFSSFVTPQLLGGGTIMTMTMLIYQQSMTLLDWPFAAAAAAVLLVFSLALLTLYNKMTSRIEKMGDKAGVFRESNFNSPWQRLVRTVKGAVYDFFATLGRALGMGNKQTRLKRRGGAGGVAGKILSRLCVVLVCGFIILPLPIVIISSFSGEKMFINFPPSSFSLRWYRSIFEKPEYLKSFWLSLRIALIAVALSLIIGTLAALAISRYKFRSVELVKTLFLSPLSLPAVITGIALLRFFIQIGWIGTVRGVMVAHVLLCTTYVIRTVLSSLVGFDMGLEEAARDLGASPFYTFRKITLPIIRPGLVVAGLFSFIVSMDETTISRFIVRGRDITLPVRIFAQLEYGLDLTVTAISSLLIVLALVILFLIDRSIGLNKFKM